MQRTTICGNPFNNGIKRYGHVLIAILLMVSLGGLTACGGSSSSSGSSGGTVPEALTSYVMPDEISAVPTAGTQDASRAYQVSVFRAFARSAAGDLPADSDYHTAGVRKYVEERTLEQFDILEEVLTALNQTHYYDQIGQPAYRAMVVQVGGDGEQAQKTLQPWVVESDIIDQNGNVVELANANANGDYDLRVRCWIEEEEDGEVELIRAEFIITDPPTQNPDGSFADYGQWNLNVKFGEGDDDFFAATCETDADGGNVITLSETFAEGGPAGDFSMEVAAIMHRSDTQGYGKVSYPDWDAVHGPDADETLTSMPHKEAVYAYNNDLLAVQDEDAAEPTYKSRTEEPVEMTHRYGVYDGDTGQDVLKTKSFGFPFFYTAGSSTRRGYYGAWQGRHQIWADGADLPLEGTVLTREDWGDAEPVTYKMGPTFDGTFVKRTYAQAQLADIQDIPVEIWINQDYQLIYEGGVWKHCPDINWGDPITCNVTAQNFGDVYGWETLTKGENDDRKHININGWDPTANGGSGDNKPFVYLAANTVGSHAAGFYLAQMNPQTHETTVVEPLEALNPANVTQLWVWIGGSIYVEYNGTNWIEKEVVFFNEQYHKPEFGPNDKPYILPEGRELYVNLQGANYVVRKESGVTTIKVELQTAANPANVASTGSLAALDGYTFREPWADNNSTYTFDTDPASGTFLMLVYATIGDNDRDQDGNPNPGVAPNNVVEKDIWGIVAYDGGAEVFGTDGEPLAFNWEHDSDGAEMNDWGSVTYLLNADDTYALLDDPIRFVSLTAQNNAGDTKTLALQFDGWMMGLPDMYQELEKNDWTMSDELADKIINLAAGTELTDASDITRTYLLKPLEISQFLPIVSYTGSLELPNVAQADSIDLTAIDIYTAPTMGGIPSGTTILYSEGKLLTD